MLNFFKRKPGEEKFWSWFQKNKSRIEQFIDANDDNYSVYEELTQQVQKYSSELFPELTKTENNEYVLIITPDGIKAGIEPTKKLVESHPAIANWVIKKFRQPSDSIDLNFDGIHYPVSDIEIVPQLDREREKVDIEVFIRNMNNDPGKYKALAFLYLDHILGEFNTLTRVGYIDFHHLEKDKSPENGIGLLQLRQLIEDELY